MSDFVIDNDGILTEYNGTNMDVIIPDYVTRIRPYVFWGKKLNSITLPDEIRFNPMDIDTDRFIVGDNNKSYSVIDGVLFDKQKETLLRMPVGKTGEYIIPDGVLYVDACAFEHTSLSKIVFPNTVKIIYRLSVDAMDRLESLVFPDDLVEMNMDCIYAPLLSSMVLPRNIDRLINLKDVRNMRWIEIKNPDFDFGEQSFTSLNMRSLSGLIYIIHHADFPISYYPVCRKQISLGTVVKKYRGIDVTDECWNDAVSYIRRNSRFYDWEKILSFDPLFLDFIGDYKILKEEQFDSLIQVYAEKNNTEFAARVLDAKEKMYPSSEQFDRILQKAEINMKKAEKEIVYQQRVKDTSTIEYAKTIWDFAPCENGCIKIKKYLGNDEDVVIPDYICGKKVVEICNFAFSQNFKSKDRKSFFSSVLKSVYIPDTVTHIGEGVFKYCEELRSVRLPQDLIVIPNDLFAGCSSLFDIVVPDSVMGIGEFAFYGCEKILDFVFPPNITIIGRQAFSNCRWMRTIILPDSVELLGAGAFYGCYNVAILRLSKNLTKLNPYVFGDCSNLRKIEIPDNIEFISKRAFDMCSKITTVIIPQKLQQNIKNCVALNNEKVNIIIK